MLGCEMGRRRYVATGARASGRRNGPEGAVDECGPPLARQVAAAEDRGEPGLREDRGYEVLHRALDLVDPQTERDDCGAWPDDARGAAGHRPTPLSNAV